MNEQFDQSGEAELAALEAKKAVVINTAIEKHVGVEGRNNLEHSIKQIADQLKTYVALIGNKEEAEHATNVLRQFGNGMFARLHSVNKKQPELVGESLTLSNAVLQVELGRADGEYLGGFTEKELVAALQGLKQRYPEEFRQAAES